MQILYKNEKDKKLFNNERLLLGRFNKIIAKAIRKKTLLIRASTNLFEYRRADIRLELLKGGYYEYSVRLTGNWRLIFTPQQPITFKEDGGIAERAVESVVVLRVEDYR